jgi:PAS domain S-box-containing protein
MGTNGIEKMSKAKLVQQNRELQEAQLRLAESTARYSDLYNLAPVGYCTLNREGCIMDINVSGAALLEKPKDQLIGRPFHSIDTVVAPDVFHTHLKQCIEGDVRVTCKLALLVRQGVQRFVRIITDPVGNGGRPSEAYRTVIVDVTEEKRSEDELMLLSNLGAVLVSEQDYSQALNAAAQVLVPALADLLTIDLMTDDGQCRRLLVLFADPGKQEALAEKMKQFFPRREPTTVQSKVIESGHPIMMPKIPDLLRARIAHDENHAELLRAAGVQSIMVVPLSVRRATFGALTFAMAESGRRYTRPNFQLAGTVATRIAGAVDNARLFDSRKKAVAARDAILAVVSHDLRNSLNVIQLKTHVMSQSPDSQSRADAAFIQRRTCEMVRLIQDLLDISSIDAGRLRLEKSHEPVEPIVRKVMETLGPEAQQKSLNLAAASTVGAALRIDCDPHRIQQVLTNLIGNAIKFTSAGGSVLVRTESYGTEVWFSITDTGPGIPPSDLPHIFERFWSAGKGLQAGTGLGLSIAKGLVETHHGRIWAESRMGVGTTFFFTVPLA